MQVNEHPVEQEEVMAYLDRELPSERAAIITAHLEECGECGQLAKELQAVSRQLGKWQVGWSAARLPVKAKRTVVWSWMGGVAAACLVITLLVLPKALRMNESSHANRAYYKPEISAFAPFAKPMIARTSQLVLITKEFDKARGALEDILKRHGGYLGQLDLTAPADGPRTLNAALRVPSDQLAPAMPEIKKLGQVESESQSGEEVSRQYADLDARLRNARNTEQRLSAMLHERTGQMPDVLAVEKEIDRVRGEIEQMQAEKKTLVNRVEFATLNVTLREASRAQLSPQSTWDRFVAAANDGYSSLMAGVEGGVVFLLSYGPSLLFWGGLVALAIRFLLRRSGRASTLLKF